MTTYYNEQRHAVAAWALEEVTLYENKTFIEPMEEAFIGIISIPLRATTRVIIHRTMKNDTYYHYYFH